MNNSESQQRYGKHQKGRLLKILEKLDYGLDFEHIKDEIMKIYDV